MEAEKRQEEERALEEAERVAREKEHVEKAAIV